MTSQSAGRSVAFVSVRCEQRTYPPYDPFHGTPTRGPGRPFGFVSVRCEHPTYPPYDAFHGTPSPMLWRRVVIETTRGSATFAQTDYGHPGRLNPWEPRRISS